MIDFIKKNIFQIFELSKFDYLLRFRRTKLGPFWNILTIFITVLLMSLVWSIIFKIDIKEYIPRLMFGFTAFIFISNTITLSVDLISDKYANELKTLNISIYFFIIRQLMVNIFDYLTYTPLFIILYLSTNIDLNYNLFFFIPSFILVILNCFWISSIFSLLGARFRDVIPLTKTIMGVGMILTPVIWDKALLGEYENFAYLNPLTFFVEAIKYPLLGIKPSNIVYIGLILFLFSGYTILHFLYKKYKINLKFWAG